ncbi:DMT family transporter [Phenylobacterium montanum]|uniref:DMT family transporter n=1 Tax=Phenylobacterium montanum TaxID=2823693 RepID=A0A975FWQ5_9CAUL|nr:DMT family transporter [Caulobacter sp. S6]QUD86332.1 DMT family transporter [Caulobacter sp. S6]
MTPRLPSHSRVFAVAGLGIGLYSMMDALMKQLSIAIGAYNAALWRSLAGVIITGLILALRKPRWPPVQALRLHGLRGLISPLLVFLFFWGVARVPLAEGIALSFIAPLITLYLAAVLLGEQVTRWSVISSLCGLAGVGVIMAARIGGPHSPDALLGALAILASAVVYSFNLILQRLQATAAAPEESAFFGTVVMAVILSGFAPFAARPPPMAQVPAIVGSALFASAAFITLSWAYARAEARVLVVLEYTAFLWAALFGFLMFKEPVTLTTLAGAALIVLGCLISAWHERSHQPSAELGI